MERQKNEAFALAAQHDTLGPLHGWLTIWADEVEIERRPDLYERRLKAEEHHLLLLRALNPPYGTVACRPARAAGHRGRTRTADISAGRSG